MRLLGAALFGGLPCRLSSSPSGGVEAACAVDLLYQTNKHQIIKTETRCSRLRRLSFKQIQLSTTDILAPASMKNAAKCDT